VGKKGNVYILPDRHNSRVEKPVPDKNSTKNNKEIKNLPEGKQWNVVKEDETLETGISQRSIIAPQSKERASQHQGENTEKEKAIRGRCSPTKKRRWLIALRKDAIAPTTVKKNA